ncbi:MAG TPA: hypothetical protein VLF18_14315 [Tahibacter sp.]|uniref:hypothetical protein n=1 Tax=Tahibacter sp. TaxID=2056211 RepID=UPI002CDA4415|nr:hypothetical protein [Tahibacter sp.]HSX61372.1 hypothetical protein [Tahibacter sp.]
MFSNEDIAPFNAMQITKTPNETSTTTTIRVMQPTLCGKVTASAAPAGFTNRVNPVFAGFYPGSGDFKFGSLSGGAQTPVQGIGYWNFRPTGLTIQSDVETFCYVLTADGVRKLSAGLFNDTFGDAPDASITTSVVALPSFSNSYYTYYVDVRIPAEFSGMKYRVRDGFDSSVFVTGSARYCPAQPIGGTQCDLSSMIYDSIDLPLVVPPGGVAQRYVVQRQLANGVQMPADTDAAVTYAALYLADGAEAVLGNNVSAGRGVLSDMSPVIITQANMVPNMAEGTGATNLSFVIADDSTEAGHALLNAAVAIDFNGNLVPATNVGCSQLETPLPGEAVRRTCRFDIPAFDPDFATDTNPSTPGTYAPGVHASVLITATDSRGQESTRSVPFHVVASENDAPSFRLTALAVEDPDKVPTLVCSLAGEGFSDQCLGDIVNFMTDLKGGPERAYDENATQWTFFAGVGSDNKLNCTGTSPSIFATQIPGGLQSPKVLVSGTSVTLDYVLNGTQTGTADCTIFLGDGNYPASHSYNQTVRQFRIRVTP